MKAIRINEQGGADVMRLEDVPQPQPGAGEVVVKLEAIGLNFIDMYQRSGLYKMKLPYTPGNEGAGTVAAVGQGVSDFQEGDRVAWANVLGSYAEYAVVPAAKLVPVPAGVDGRTAAALALQGMTAHYLTHSTYPLKKGDTFLIHAAAGGVGLHVVQMARIIGARSIGTVGSAPKAELAKSFGLDEVVNYQEQDFEAEVKRLTNGRGVPVVYDSVGKTTFEKSINCLQPRGYMVLFGQSSGPVDPVDPMLLNRKGSLFLTRPSLGPHVATREELLWRANEIFGWVADGRLKVHIGQEFSLAQAAEAQLAQEGRRTAGKTLLIP